MYQLVTVESFIFIVSTDLTAFDLWASIFSWKKKSLITVDFMSLNH